MSATFNAYGLRPVYAEGHFAQSRRIDFGIPSGYATSLYQYEPVALNAAGQIVGASVSADFIGVFMGVTYFDATGIPHSYNQWIAGTVVQAGQPLWVWVHDDINQVYQIQADGSVAQSVGAQLNFTTSNINSGNTITGLSSCSASAASLTTSGQGQLRIVELAPSPALNGVNLWGDAYTELRVKIARHQYWANKTAV